MCWSSDGKKLIAPQAFGDKIYTLDITAKTTIPTVYSDLLGINIGADPIYTELCPGPLRNHFSVASENFVQIWQLGKTDGAEKVLYCDKNQNLNLTKLNWSNDGSTLAALAQGGDDHMRVALWNMKKGQVAATLITLPPRSPQFTFFRLTDTVAWSPVDPNLLLLSNADVAVVADLKEGAGPGFGCTE